MYDAEEMVADAACAADVLVGHANRFADAVSLCTRSIRVGDSLAGVDAGEWNRFRGRCGGGNLGAISSSS